MHLLVAFDAARSKRNRNNETAGQLARFFSGVSGMNWFKRVSIGRDLGWMFLSFGVLIAGIGVLSTGVALALDEREYTDALTQFVPSLYYVGMALGSMTGRHWLRWLGPVRLFVVCSAAGSVFCLLVLKASTVFDWAVLRLLQGASLAGVYISVEVVLNTTTENHMRGRTIALYQVVTYSFMAIGQWIVGYLWWGEVSWFLAASTLVAVGGGMAWCSLSSSPGAAPPQRVRPEALVQGVEPVRSVPANRGSIRLGLYVAAVAGVLLSSFYTVFPVVAHDLLGDLPSTGSYLAMGTLAALPSLFLIAHQADRHGRKPAIYTVATLMTLALLLLAWSDARWIFWVGGLSYAGLVFTVYGLGISDVNDRVGDGRRDVAAAWTVLMFSLGGCLGPWLSGWAYAKGGASGYFLVSASAAFSMLLFGSLTSHREQKFRLERSL